MSLLYVRKRAEAPQQLPHELLDEVRGALPETKNIPKTKSTYQGFIRILAQYEESLKQHENVIISQDSIKEVIKHLSDMCVEHRGFPDAIKSIELSFQRESLDCKVQNTAPNLPYGAFPKGKMLPPELLEEVRRSLEAQNKPETNDSIESRIENLRRNIEDAEKSLDDFKHTTSKLGSQANTPNLIFTLVETLKKNRMEYFAILRSLGEAYYSGREAR